MRNCPFHGCGRQIPEYMFACKEHWFTLTAAERNRIWSSWERYKGGELPVEDLRAIQQEVLMERGTA